MSTQSLRELFIDEVKDIYDAEQRLTKALPKMVKAANSEELASAFDRHLKETQQQVSRLERVLEIFDETPSKKTCKAMVGLLEEGQELMNEGGAPSVQDAALIAAAQKVEHYEMATYGCLRTWADLLDEDEASRLLQETLDEEGETDKKLTEIAETLGAYVMDGKDEGEDEDQDEDAERAPAAAATTTRRSGGNRPAKSRKS